MSKPVNVVKRRIDSGVPYSTDTNGIVPLEKKVNSDLNFCLLQIL